jgi:hypothetical protein
VNQAKLKRVVTGIVAAGVLVQLVISYETNRGLREERRENRERWGRAQEQLEGVKAELAEHGEEIRRRGEELARNGKQVLREQREKVGNAKVIDTNFWSTWVLRIVINIRLKHHQFYGNV